MAFATPKRLLLKISGEALKGNLDYGFDMDCVTSVAHQIKSLVDRGIQIAIVCGAGNIYRGAPGKGLQEKNGHYIGMLATVMNGIALADALESIGQPATVLSAVEMPKVAELFTRTNATQYLDEGKVVISSFGTGNPFFTTDTGGVQRALELGCDYFVKATKVDGIYSADPVKDPSATRYDQISLQEANAKGLRIMDHSALGLASQNGLELFVCRLEDMEKIGTEDEHGTYVTKD